MPIEQQKQPGKIEKPKSVPDKTAASLREMHDLIGSNSQTAKETKPELNESEARTAAAEVLKQNFKPEGNPQYFEQMEGWANKCLALTKNTKLEDGAKKQLLSRLEQALGGL